MEENRVKRLSVTHTAKHAEKEQTTSPDRAGKVTLHAFICVCILCAALVLKALDTPWSANIQEGIATALSFDIDAEETLGRLKFVQLQMEDTVTAFAAQGVGEGDAHRMPVQGAVLRTYSDTGEYILLNVQSAQVIACPSDGIVSDVTEESIAIDFTDGTSGLLSKLGQVQVQKGDAVKAGEIIALADEAGTPIRFTVYQSGASIDPEVWVRE